MKRPKILLTRKKAMVSAIGYMFSIFIGYSTLLLLDYIQNPMPESFLTLNQCFGIFTLIISCSWIKATVKIYRNS